MSSDAVGLERVSRIIGYKITKGNFSNTTPNLPQRIAILAEANSANQSSVTDGVPKEITSAQQAGQLYGYGSPVYHIMRILRPNSGTGIGGIPTVVYPQEEASAAAAKVLTLAPAGTATANGTHTLVIAGRTGLDGVFYDINIQAGDDAKAVASKIITAVSAVLGCPLTVTLGGGEDADEVILTSKWKGLTANDLNVSVNTNDKDLGITYAITSTASGSGTPSVLPALNNFGNEWNTIVINSYGTVSNVIEALENFNGVPDPENPTGRYSGIIMKPFIALTGFTGEDPSTTVTDVAARKDQVTIAICPAPLSKGLAMEAAANMAVLFGRQTQDTPHLDVAARSYPDMPTPAGIGLMARYEDRDAMVKKGCSTVDLVNGRYAVQDFVTTYHPEGENPPQFRYCRNLMLDFNIRFSYFLKEQTYVVDHAIAANDDIVSASKVVKPKQWKQVLDQMADDLARRSLIVDAGFMKDSIEVNISSINPDRLETFFKYKRSGFARISSTTVEAGFNFGNV